MSPMILINRPVTAALAIVFMLAPVAGAQTDCNDLAQTLRSERDVRFDYDEARYVYDLVCSEEERATSRTSQSSLSAGYSSFVETYSASARGGRSSAEEYRSAFCDIDRSQVVRQISREIRERSTSPATLRLLSQCLSKELGINLTLESYEKDTRVIIGLRDVHEDERFLNAIIAPRFKCSHRDETIGKTGRNGERVPLTSDAFAIDCQRQGESRTINGTAYAHYPTASLTLDLSTGVRTLELPERDLGPVTYEFTNLQRRVGELEVQNVALDKELSGYMNRQWCDVTTQREEDKKYDNDGEYPIEVAITTSAAGNYNFCDVRVYVTNFDGEKYVVRNTNNNSSKAKICSATATIPPSQSYKVNADGYRRGRVVRWAELRDSCPEDE